MNRVFFELTTHSNLQNSVLLLLHLIQYNPHIFHPLFDYLWIVKVWIIVVQVHVHICKKALNRSCWWSNFLNYDPLRTCWHNRSDLNWIFILTSSFWVVSRRHMLTVPVITTHLFLSCKEPPHSPRVELESLSAMLSVSLVSGLAATAVRRRRRVTGDMAGMSRTTEQIFFVYVTDWSLLLTLTFSIFSKSCLYR